MLYMHSVCVVGVLYRVKVMQFHCMFAAILIEYFYSGRPYKMVLQRLKLVHGTKRRQDSRLTYVLML